jgi:peptidoglycan/LPS O-acetylase OafA/YrhL
LLHKPRQIASSSHISLDLIQYFSCLIVFAGHFCQIFLYRIWGLNNTVNNVQHPFICALSHAATFAVMVFFVLSGLLVAYSTINDTATADSNPRQNDYIYANPAIIAD